jgi:hypothetical protein
MSSKVIAVVAVPFKGEFTLILNQMKDPFYSLFITFNKIQKLPKEFWYNKIALF